MDTKKATAVVVGGSIAGVSCAHALILAGWDVVVLEKSCAPPSGSPTGAGLSLDPQTCQLIESWLPHPDLLLQATLHLSIDQDQATDSEKKISWTLTRDESFNFRAAHWADLHDLLYKPLTPDIFLWGHHFLSFHMAHDKAYVIVKAKNLKTGEIVEIVGDLLIAADGCMSEIRQSFLPDLQLRYTGYSAWRGVLDFLGDENSETIIGIRKAYPELGKCLYFDLAHGSHCVLYELRNKRLNWIWYLNQPEPELKIRNNDEDYRLGIAAFHAQGGVEHFARVRNLPQGNSVTMKVSKDMIQKMHEEAEKVWVPELARVMKETKEPFINVIYDCDPLQQLFWERVVLVGDAAHPTSPHGIRSTNMSIMDAGILGQCLKKWGLENMDSALNEFQSIRLPVVSKQVLHSPTNGSN
ncbi:Monooxygenase, FAD-binding protein [Cinnamomum micranthum f. kanehirae]|uniref:Monooxygenase, FAD-binding protein n=1 Tax=Cinnamomum micranthum f. kanehirae TaxID=337451 RepID=A0A443N414_9MAGN|nr:Monooxygenase, FAD-binding protein [Cinnamomum micranthum f. kanehirae]